MTTATCRRCSECRYQSHHWFEDVDGEHDPPAFDYSCKHCDAKAHQCDHCHGDGDDPDADEMEPCPRCDGEGVLPAQGAK